MKLGIVYTLLYPPIKQLPEHKIKLNWLLIFIFSCNNKKLLKRGYKKLQNSFTDGYSISSNSSISTKRMRLNHVFSNAHAVTEFFNHLQW